MNERTEILKCTENALAAVAAPRYFATERGFHGEFYAHLRSELTKFGQMEGGRILEMENQKSRRHGTRQRPDIVLHVPTEHSGRPPRENNFAIWALKRRATVTEASEDFRRLDEMFEILHYPLGFFVNISSDSTMREHYKGDFGDRLHGVAVRLERNGTCVRVEGPP